LNRQVLGDLGVPNMMNEYAAYKINNVANLMLTEAGKKIWRGYLEFNDKFPLIKM
jgi:hypothetical protein